MRRPLLLLLTFLPLATLAGLPLIATLEELAYQTWGAQKITKEQFFYDPKQFKQSPQAGEHATPPRAGSAA